MTDPDAPDPADPPGDQPANLPLDPENGRERVLALVRARCPELSDDDLALLGAPDPDDTGIPVWVADKIMDVLSAFEDRLSALEAEVRA